MKYPNQIITEVGDFIEVHPDLVERRLNFLKNEGTLPQSLETKNLESLASLETPLKEKVIEEILNLIDIRQTLGYKTIIGYHASPIDIKVGGMIHVGTDGKAYFNDLDGLDELYSRNGSVRFVYQIKADAKIPDEKEFGGSRSRFYSRSPLKVLKKWRVKKFMKQHPDAEFRSC